MARARYAGTSRKLLIAFDIGTTFSGASYSILDPVEIPEIPEIRTVTRFPMQEHAGGGTKIPTIIYYDQAGEVRAVGAEALQESVEVDAEEEGWHKAEWFKLHMRPKGAVTRAIPPLPPKKTVINILADYLRYLHNCTKTFIQETHVDGEVLWNSLQSNVVYVLTHPNGWGGPQQKQMRTAAVRAGLIPNTEEGRERISFMTEGEASLHYCIRNGLAVDGTKNGAGVLVIDAGGGTVDISAYHEVDGKYEEIGGPECLFQDSAFVTSWARGYFTDYLKDSPVIRDIDALVDRFDKEIKPSFRSDRDEQFIQFASARERDAILDIDAGRLKLPGSVVATFFEPSIRQIISAVKKQQADSPHPLSSVFLVGGFAANDWLFSTVKVALESSGLKVSRPNSRLNNVVVDGAASHYVDPFFRGGVSETADGSNLQRSYYPDGYIDSSASNRTPSGNAKDLPIHYDNRINIEEERERSASHPVPVAAIRLDKELNAPDVQMKDGSGKHVEPSEKDMPDKYSENGSSTTDAQAPVPQSQSQSRSSGGALAWALGGSNPDRQIDKLKEKVASLKKKLEHAEDVVNYYHKAAQQERAAHTRTWNACKSLEMELNGARQRIHQLEEEMHGAKIPAAGSVVG